MFTERDVELLDQMVEALERRLRAESLRSQAQAPRSAMFLLSPVHAARDQLLRARSLRDRVAAEAKKAGEPTP